MSVDPEDSQAVRCPRCEVLEARVAELERRLAEVEGGDSGSEEPQAAHRLPPFSLRALRMLDRGWAEGWAIRPSPARRVWMDEHPLAYQCLPLVVANQWGWQILCPTDVRATWDGSPDRLGVWIEVDSRYAVSIKSQFGRGIVTFSPPWLFRTPPGWSLYAKGPSNRWKVNCVPLEGVIETWWLKYTFTLNWKIVEPGSVTFAKGESLGQIVPVPHSTFRGATADELPISTEPETFAELLRWREERRRIAQDPVRQHHYYRRAEMIPDHLIRVPVPPLARAQDPEPPPSPPA